MIGDYMQDSPNSFKSNDRLNKMNKINRIKWMRKMDENNDKLNINIYIVIKHTIDRCLFKTSISFNMDVKLVHINHI